MQDKRAIFCGIVVEFSFYLAAEVFSLSWKKFFGA